ncbi:MAG: YbjN domain-containing protein [Planctomycetaceae bacterium]|nr:YbjN domain-containing protein [Planctomycetales bacterium]MCB9926384.1 YbjN domain-containing protein [Planctomycetaceae bacterium]
MKRIYLITKRKEVPVNTAFDNLIAHFDEHGLSYRVDAEQRLIRTGYQGRVCSCELIAVADEGDDFFQVIAFVPVAIPEGCRAAVVETITRANFGLKIGKFEFDYDEGRLRFQVCQVLVDGRLDEQMIRHAIACCLSMIDRYVPAVLSVIYGNEQPQDAVRFAEADVAR